MKILVTVMAISFMIAGTIVVVYDLFDNQSANIVQAVLTPTPEPLCDNYTEVEDFDKSIPIVWTARMDGCLMSCAGASFTRVPEDEKYPRFAGYFPASFGLELEQDNAVLKISGDWVGIAADHPHTVFEDKCVPIIEIDKIEPLN